MSTKTPPYPGDVPMQGSSVSGTTPEQVDPSRLLRSNDVETGSGPAGIAPESWYHGTNVPGLTSFDRRFLDESEPGFAFTNDRQIALDYANARVRDQGGEPVVYEVNLDPRRFEEMDREGESYSPEVHDQLWNDLDSWNGQYGVSGTIVRNMPDSVSSAMNQYRNGEMGHHVAYVFDPNAIHMRSSTPAEKLRDILSAERAASYHNRAKPTNK